MRTEIYQRLLCERNETIAFNMGFHTAVYVLEQVEKRPPLTMHSFLCIKSKFG